jgi:hypothetical protein
VFKRKNETTLNANHEKISSIIYCLEVLIFWIILIVSRVGELSSQSRNPNGMYYYFTAGGCMSERIRDRYEKTSLLSQFDQDDECRWPPKQLVSCSLLVFSLQCLMREFVAAGGEMIIHGAPQLEKLPDP